MQKVLSVCWGKILNTDHTLIYRWIRTFAEGLPEAALNGEISQMEFDEMWHFIGSKKESFWVIKAVDRSTRRTVA